MRRHLSPTGTGAHSQTAAPTVALGIDCARRLGSAGHGFCFIRHVSGAGGNPRRALPRPDAGFDTARKFLPRRESERLGWRAERGPIARERDLRLATCAALAVELWSAGVCGLCLEISAQPSASPLNTANSPMFHLSARAQLWPLRRFAGTTEIPVHDRVPFHVHRRPTFPVSSFAGAWPTVFSRPPPAEYNVAAVRIGANGKSNSCRSDEFACVIRMASIIVKC